MDLENQKRVKDFAEEFGPENVIVILGASEAEASGLAAETVTAGDPTFACLVDWSLVGTQGLSRVRARDQG